MLKFRTLQYTVFIQGVSKVVVQTKAGGSVGVKVTGIFIDYREITLLTF